MLISVVIKALRKDIHRKELLGVLQQVDLNQISMSQKVQTGTTPNKPTRDVLFLDGLQTIY